MTTRHACAMLRLTRSGRTALSALASVRESVQDSVIEGHCDPVFEPLAQEFIRNFRERGESGRRSR